MNHRVAVPKTFRRNDRWYVRVQVPGSMQARLLKKEYWISLGTTDRQEALRIAPGIVAEKRDLMNRVYNRSEGYRKTVTEFIDEQRQSVFRDAYHRKINGGSDIIEMFEDSKFKTLPEFLSNREKSFEHYVSRLKQNRGDVPEINLLMLYLQRDHVFTVAPGSKAEEELRKLCVEAVIEGHRNQLSRMRGLPFQPQPNPELVDTETGRPRDFTDLGTLLARPKAEPLSLSRLVEEFIANPNRLRTTKTKKSIRGSMEVVIEILGDDKPVEEITEADCERVRDLLMQLPPNFRKLPALRDRPIEEMTRIANAKGMSKLTPTAVNTYLKWLTTFMTWCQKKGKIAKVPTSFSEISVADPERREHKRHPFSDDQLQTYFHSRVFAENASENCIFWVSLIALWNGMRSNEICQLDVADVVSVEGIWGFDITHLSTSGDDDKSVKTGASLRLIPIHPKLLNFGFLDFHQSRPPDAKLFADITRGADGYYSSTFSKKSNRYLRQIGVHGPKTKFHSFRHNFRDALRRGRVDREIGKALGGWQRGKTDAFDIYGSGFPIDELEAEIRRVDYPKVDWSHLTN